MCDAFHAIAAFFADERFYRPFAAFLLAIITAGVGRVLGEQLLDLSLNRRKERRKKAENRQNLVALLRRTLESNRSACTQMIGELSGSAPGGFQVPSYNVDLAVLSATAAIHQEVLNDLALSQSIDTARFELMHLERRIDALAQLAYSATVQNIGGHIASTLQIAQTAKNYCDSAIASLTSYRP